MIYAFSGEVVTCEDGHPYAQFTRDVHVGEACAVDALRFADGSKPDGAATIKKCHCGADAIVVGFGGGMAFIAGKWRTTK